jgi:hypothetical protein
MISNPFLAVFNRGTPSSLDRMGVATPISDPKDPRDQLNPPLRGGDFQWPPPETLPIPRDTHFPGELSCAAGVGVCPRDSFPRTSCANAPDQTLLGGRVDRHGAVITPRSTGGAVQHAPGTAPMGGGCQRSPHRRPGQQGGPKAIRWPISDQPRSSGGALFVRLSRHLAYPCAHGRAPGQRTLPGWPMPLTLRSPGVPCRVRERRLR